MEECHKTAFNSFKEAQTLINRAKHGKNHKNGRKGPRKMARKDNIPVRSYLCPNCGKWHVTSKKEKYGK